ncbi:MAG: GNAT family N-acetyltransferase [Emcibacteraceae bacterium]|nr:GNAT family N-acetyltransferase [Emcibacteraceae bacterium]
MTDFLINKTNADDLNTLKKEFLKSISTPRDGMWEAFVTMADHYSINHENNVIGYCVINEEHKILQFHVDKKFDQSQIFKQIISEKNATGAFASTVEPQFLSLCMDHQKSVSVNALMYQVQKNTPIEKAKFPDRSEFKLMDEASLETAVQFAHKTIGADQGWLNYYYLGLIKRKELFGLWLAGELIATGECRVSDIQKPAADLGMIVSNDHRDMGIATNIIRHLLNLCNERNLDSICSTEADNIAAHKAITKSGFISGHRILEISFT